MEFMDLLEEWLTLREQIKRHPLASNRVIQLERIMHLGDQINAMIRGELPAASAETKEKINAALYPTAEEMTAAVRRTKLYGCPNNCWTPNICSINGCAAKQARA